MPTNEYLEFMLDQTRSLDRKTQVWIVYAVRGGAKLGEIRWFGRWRQYAFYPEPETIWNPDCLDAVSAKVRELMAARKENKLVIGKIRDLDTPIREKLPAPEPFSRWCNACQVYHPVGKHLLHPALPGLIEE